MTHRFRFSVVAVVFAAAASLFAAVDPAGFEPVPKEAVSSLKRVRAGGKRGSSYVKPVQGGAVFVNGRFVAPPYKIVRHGTALAVNDVQVTGQLVPWGEFTSEAAPAAAPAPKKPAPKKAEPAKPAPKKEATSIDDLFGDAPAKPAEKKEAAKPAAVSVDDLFADAPSAPAKPAAAKKPADEGDDGSDGDDVKLDPVRAQTLVKKIETARTRVVGQLERGDALFFGVAYDRLRVESRMTAQLFKQLPEQMRDAADGADLFARLRGAGVGFLPREVCEDLMKNRACYPQLIERRRSLDEEAAMRRMLDGVN